MQSVVDLIRQYFGDEPGPDLIVKLNGALPPEFKKFREHYDTWRREGPHVPTRKATELRPFIAGDYFSGDALSLYKLMFQSSSKQERMVYEAVDAIKHHLLYCHSVALENPLQHLLFERERSGGLPTTAGPYLHGRGGMLGFDFNGGSLFRNYLTFLSHIMPLLKTGAVVLVEAHWGGVTRWPIELPDNEMSAAIDGLDVDTSGYFPGEEEDESTHIRAKRSIVGRLLEYLHFVARIREQTGSAIDLQVRNERDRIVLNHLQRRCGELVGVIHRDADLRRLSTLLKFRVPGLNELSARDISALREGTAFADFRHALAGALDRMHGTEGGTRSQTSEDFRSLALANLEPQIEQLNKEIRSSAFLSKFSGNAVDMGVGLLLDFLLGTMGVVTATTLARQGFEGVYKARKESGAPAQAEARSAHYALFQSAV